MKNLFLSAAFFALAPIASQAATVVNAYDGLVQSYSSKISSGEVLEFKIVPDEKLDFLFSLSGSGTKAALEKISFGFSASDKVGYTTITKDPKKPSIYGAIGFLPGLVTGDAFSIFYFADPSLGSSPAVTLSIEAVAPTPVPLPATGALAIAGIAGLAALARRRSV